MPHKPHIEACGAEFRAVKTASDLADIDALILPGGESTTMLRLIERFGLWDDLAAFFAQKPVWGICAGAILLAKTVRNPEQKSFGVLDIDICRNGYGRQLESHFHEVEGYPVSFIRAPVIERVGEAVEVLAAQADRPVWVRQGRVLASAFHPELTLDFPSPMHRHFIDIML